MKTWQKSLVCISLSLMSLLACVGYAVVSETLQIIGMASAEVPTGIYITDITEVGASGIDKNVFSFIPTTTNVMNTVSKSEGDTEGVIEYAVTVYNNTNTAYFYRDIYFQTEIPEYNGNDYVSEFKGDNNVFIECVFENDSNEAKKLEPQEKIVFTVYYTVGKDIDADIDLNMLVNIRFGIHVAGEWEAVDSIEARFLEILNTESTYKQLIDVLDDKFNGWDTWTANYVGNVAGATAGAFSNDSVTVNNLFQNRLQMTIDGELREATVIIKHENVDWDYGTGDSYVAYNSEGLSVSDSGCEMILYLTIDSLDDPGAYVPVYAMVFTCDISWQTGERVSDWYRIGSTYIGKAEVADYDGTVGGTGSFRTTTWVSDVTSYEVVKGYSFEIQNYNTTDTYYLDSFSYEVDGYYNLHYTLETYNEEALRVLEQLIADAKRIVDNPSYAGEGIDGVRAVYEKYYWLYAWNNGKVENTWPINTARKFHPAIVELYKNVYTVLNTISNLS